MSQTDNYNLLLNKLDRFIRKFYLNRLLRGSLIFVALILVLFLGLNFLEHFFYFSSSVRKVLFFSFLIISGLSLFAWVIRPILQYYRLGRVISKEQAAGIIGDHFSTVQDKLLNVLQLKEKSDFLNHKDLILASIDQKSQEIRPISFQSAINLARNRKYLRYTLPPLLLLLIILFTAPSIIKDSTHRLLKNNIDFERPAPFSFVVENSHLQVVQFEDFPLSVKIEGEELPNEVYIEVDDYQYRLNKEQANLFTYRFNNVQKETRFQLFSSGVSSKTYTLDILEKPNLLGFEVNLEYPTYIQRKDESLSSIGDLVVPTGTEMGWVFNAQQTDEIGIKFGEEAAIEAVERIGEDLFTVSKKALKDQSYKIYVSNEELPNADSISYSITVIPDLYPEITAEKFQDSTDNKLLYFVGDASDDYGLLSLSFNYSIKRRGADDMVNSIKMQKPSGKQIQFNHVFDLNSLDLELGDEITYFFEVYDNDEINGSKSARTNLMVFSVPTIEELKAKEEANEEQIKDDLEKALSESKKIQEDLKKMKEKLLQEKELDWQSRKELEKLLDRQKNMEEQIQDAKEYFEENLKNQEEFEEKDEEIIEKQEKLQELFEELLSEEMKELMQQIEELLQELEKDDALEMIEEMEFNDEELENELDRMLELFKQLELEQEMNEAIEDLQQLAEEQEELSEQTEEQDPEGDEEQENNTEQQEGENEEQKQGEENTENESQENQPSEQQQNQGEQQQQQGEQQQQNQQPPTQQDLIEQQQEINEKFDQIQEKMDDIENKNQELDSPKNMQEREQEMNDIQQDLNNSQQQLQQNQNNKASQSQKNAAQKMKEMANSMMMQMQSGEMQQMQEDMQALRQLLENLVGLSFDQEDLMKSFDEVIVNTPKYVDLVQQQFKLKDDFKLVEDSLHALSKRVYQIESFVTEKVSEIKSNMNSSLEDLEARKKTKASGSQQAAMKNVNDLALMLSEVLNNMQQQMSAMMAGNQMCNNPQQGQQGKDQNGIPTDQLIKGQEQLNQRMRQMKEALEKGGLSSKEFAQMAARQAALRKALKEKQKKMQERGQGTSKELQELIDKMDESETELVNKKLTNEMLKRQEDIITRLLEHEKAEREREYEEERKSRSARQTERKVPPSLEEYIKKRESEIEMYRAVSPSLKPYYKFLVEEYFKTLKQKK